LTGDNQYYCPNCKKSTDAIFNCYIIQPPNKLVINIDYGKDKIYPVSELQFDEIIDITNLISFNFGKKIQYKISGISTHLGPSGSFGHYIAYCRNKENGKWYKFNDSSCYECNSREIYGGDPYLLLYELI